MMWRFNNSYPQNSIVGVFIIASMLGKECRVPVLRVNRVR